MILSYNSDFGLTAAAYPSLTETDPRRKGKNYVIQFGRAFFTHYVNSGSRDFLNGRRSGRYAEAELYAGGRQPVKAILKDEDGHRDMNTQDKAGLRKALKLMPKYLRAVDGKLKDHDFTATVTPIDATAQDERRAYEAAMRVQMEHGEFLKSLGIPPPGGQAGPEVPIDEDELQLHMELKYRHHDAMLLEMKLARALYLADYPQQNRQCLRHETIYGSSVLYLGLRGPHRLPVALNPGNCMFLPTDTENYANLQAGAHIEKISLAALLKEVEADPDTTFTADEVERLVSIAKQNMPGSGSRNTYYDDTLGGRPEMAGQLEVVRFSFKSQDMVVQKEGVNKFGNPQVRDKPAGYTGQTDAKGTVHRRTVASWYEGSLILGTDLGYGCRKAYEQLRDEDNPFDCHPLYIVTSPDIMGGYTESIVEQCMALLDEASSAWSRARFKLATMRGSWIEINYDAIQSAVATSGTGSVTQSIAGLIRDGIIVVRPQEIADSGGQYRPAITAGELPFEKEVNMQFAVIEQCKAQIEAITGINGSISAEDPASRQGAGVTQMAISGAENTLDYLYHAKQSRFERVVRALAVSIKQTEDRAPMSGPVPVNGRVEIVGKSDTLSQRVTICKVERKPTEREWARFYDQVSIALTSKEINLSDAGFIQQIDNLKQATAMLGVRAKRNQMQASQSAQEQTSMASEQQMASAKVTAEEARKTNAELHAQAMELQTLKNEGAVMTVREQNAQQAAANEAQIQFNLTKQQEDLAHKAQMGAQQQDAKLAMHDAQLSSQEQESGYQRAHEAEQGAADRAAQPAPVAA